ncbi:MAG: molybdopterin-dependent oxidoreductase [Anaerolineae bacterium]
MTNSALLTRGVLAMCAALAIGLVGWWTLGWDYAPALVAERIIELTPAEWAVPLMNALGILAKPWAVSGGVALLSLLGGLGALFFRAARDWNFSILRNVISRHFLPSGTSRMAVPSWENLASAGRDFSYRRDDMRFRDLLKLETRGWLRRARASVLLTVVMGAVLCIIMSRPEWTALATVLVYSALLWLWDEWPALVRANARPTSAAQSRAGMTRRTFLRDLGRSILGIAVVAATGGAPMVWRALQETTVRVLFAFQPSAPRSPQFANIPGLSPEVTPNDRFYVMSKTAEDPRVQIEDWKLTLSGRVTQPLTLRLDDLLAMPRVDQFTTLECVSNPVGGRLLSNTCWSGVRLANLLARAGVEPGAQSVVCYARDAFADSIPFDLAQHPETLIAYAMNGVLLTPIHGAPARLVVPGLYGFKNVKWVERIEVLDRPYRGRWQELGWSEEAIVKTTSRIDTIQRTGNQLTIAGVAFAGVRGIRSVEVRLDDGEWLTAQLHTPPLSSLAWVQWCIAPQVATTRKIAVRAWDGANQLQLADRSEPYPNGASGWHTVEGEW